MESKGYKRFATTEAEIIRERHVFDENSLIEPTWLRVCK
jgi:hypothetical protein